MTVESRDRGAPYEEQKSRPLARTEPQDASYGRVRVEGSITKNMGNFQSLRVSVAVELPCEGTLEGAEALYRRLSPALEDLLNSELNFAADNAEKSLR